MCSVCPSRKMTIVETCHDHINQVTLCIFTFESLVVSAILTKDVLFVLVGSEPGDFCVVLVCSFVLFLFFALPVIRVAIHGWISPTVDCRCLVSIYATTVIIHVPGIFISIIVCWKKQLKDTIAVAKTSDS